MCHINTTLGTSSRSRGLPLTGSVYSRHLLCSALCVGRLVRSPLGGTCGLGPGSVHHTWWARDVAGVRYLTELGGNATFHCHARVPAVDLAALCPWGADVHTCGWQCPPHAPVHCLWLARLTGSRRSVPVVSLCHPLLFPG